MNRLLIICIVLLVSTISLYSQNKMIKGRVIDEDLETSPFVSIRVNDSIEVGKTDINGFFQLQIPDSVNNLLFNTVGAELAYVKLIDGCNDVELIMMFAGTYDFMTLKKVDRHRKRRFKKLPELHKEAFLKGLFKDVKACHTLEFIAFNSKNKVTLP